MTTAPTPLWTQISHQLEVLLLLGREQQHQFAVHLLTDSLALSPHFVGRKHQLPDGTRVWRFDTNRLVDLLTQNAELQVLSAHRFSSPLVQQVPLLNLLLVEVEQRRYTLHAASPERLHSGVLAAAPAGAALESRNAFVSPGDGYGNYQPDPNSYCSSH